MYFAPSTAPLKHRALIGVAACSIDLQAVGGEAAVPTDIPLTPAGRFRARDGRPEGIPGWYIDATIAQNVIAWANAQADDFVIDYDHQTLNTEKNGQPAPAAGWFKRLEWREPDAEGKGGGLWALGVRWTEAARAAIAAGEYRYISPVLVYDEKTGTVLAVMMAALVNYAGIDGLSDLGTRAAAKFSFTPQPQEEDNAVNREQLIALLGLAKDATDEQINAALTALKARADLAGEVRTALGVTEDNGIAGAITALKAKAQPDLSQYVPKAMYDELRGQVVALKANSDTAEMDRLIEEGLKDGRIAGKATADHLRSQGIAALKAHLQDAPSIAALKSTQTQGKQPDDDGKDKTLGEEQLAVCKAMGLTPEQFKAAQA